MTAYCCPVCPHAVTCADIEEAAFAGVEDTQHAARATETGPGATHSTPPGPNTTDVIPGPQNAETRDA